MGLEIRSQFELDEFNQFYAIYDLLRAKRCGDVFLGYALQIIGNFVKNLNAGAELVFGRDLLNLNTRLQKLEHRV